MTKLGEMLTLYNRVHSIGVRGLGEQIGVSPATVSRIMNGEDISQTVMLKILNWLFKEIV